MNNKIFCFFLSAVLAITLISVVSALDISSVSNTAVNPPYNVTGRITLTNTNSTYNITGLTCSITSTFSTRSITCPTEILAGSSVTPEYSIYVPPYTSARTDTVTITASGILNGTVVSNSTTFNITVNTYPSLSLSWITEPSDVYQGANATAIVNVTNVGNIPLIVNLMSTFANVSVNDSLGTLSAGQSVLRTISINTSTKTKIGANDFSVTANGIGTANTSTSISKSINVNYHYCPINATASPVYIEEITNADTIKEKEYKPLDSITVKVKVKNSYTESKDVVVEAALFKSSALENADDELKQKVSAESSKTFTLNITIPSDISEGDYYLLVKAYDDDKSSNCDQKSVKVSVKRKSHEIILKDVVFPSTVECNNVLEISGTLINLGSKYEEKVKLYYYDGLFSDSLEFNELDPGDMRDFSFSFPVSKNATEKSYTAYLRVYYNYDDEEKIYDDSDSFPYTYSISGNCFKEIKNFSISALTQTAFVSKDNDITFALQNTGNVAETYTITVTSNDFIIKSISPSTITLPATSTISVTIKAVPKENITSGMHNINIAVTYSGKTETKTLSLDVQKTSFITGAYNYIKNQISNASWLVITCVILAIVIIILIIKLLFTKPKVTAAPKVAEAYRSNIKKNFK